MAGPLTVVVGSSSSDEVVAANELVSVKGFDKVTR